MPARTVADALEVVGAILAPIVGTGDLQSPDGTQRQPRHKVLRFVLVLDVQPFAVEHAEVVTKAFGPEHGFRGDADAGEHAEDQIDPKTGIPVISLYGKINKPTPEMLSDVDVLVFDLQDVGCRFYTYIYLLQRVMEAGGENNVPVVVLDRPNPNGHYVDGNILDPAFSSFVGRRCKTGLVNGWAYRFTLTPIRP